MRAILPGTLAGECRVRDIRGSTIIVTCRNASSATKLRFLAPDLLEKLKDLASFHRATDIQIRVSNQL